MLKLVILVITILLLLVLSTQPVLSVKKKQRKALCGCLSSRRSHSVGSGVRQKSVVFCICVCVYWILRELSGRVLQSSVAGHSGCGSRELSNWSSYVSLTFSSSKSLYSLLSLSLSSSISPFFLWLCFPILLCIASLPLFLSLSLSRKRGV